MTSTKALKDTIAFKKIKVGKNELAHRIVLAPTTRFRGQADHTPSDLNLKFYDDRSKVPGSLLITEATFVSQGGGGYDNVPGIWSDKHVKAWKKITDKVHANGSFISVQGWHLGRVAAAKVLKREGLPLVGPSEIYESEDSKKAALEAGLPIHALTEQEVHSLVVDTYTKAAKNAIAAGFDYFEIHGANGYLVDQFLHPCSNTRNDKYGGSVENRARFLLELIDRLTEEIGADRLAVRLSPWSTFQGILSHDDVVSPYTTFSYILRQLQIRADRGNEIAYVSTVEPRLDLGRPDGENVEHGSNGFFYDVWKGKIVRAGGYGYDEDYSALKKDIENDRTLIAFARDYTSNPDLPAKLRDGLELTPFDRNEFYQNYNWGYNTWNREGEAKTYNEEEEKKRFPKDP